MNYLKQDATIFNISQIGGLVRNITDETISKYIILNGV